MVRGAGVPPPPCPTCTGKQHICTVRAAGVPGMKLVKPPSMAMLPRNSVVRLPLKYLGRRVRAGWEGAPGGVSVCGV